MRRVRTATPDGPDATNGAAMLLSPRTRHPPPARQSCRHGKRAPPVKVTHSILERQFPAETDTATGLCAITQPTHSHSGDRVIDPTLAAAALAGGPNPVTDRECEVLRAVADGPTNAELAKTLHLSAGAIRNYLSTAIQNWRCATGRRRSGP
ncbi:desR protein [Streptomyces bottropensis ATCC 25435]|uniref:DesR protein n=1 Tax=Streptomyces bottropensis ATCC 25435 TaxID=1054862 RepID=M3EE71_9ACTN|nr:desR protein [Streptomyces bottropensis ATCC 25435]